MVGRGAGGGDTSVYLAVLLFIHFNISQIIMKKKAKRRKIGIGDFNYF